MLHGSAIVACTMYVLTIRKLEWCKLPVFWNTTSYRRSSDTRDGGGTNADVSLDISIWADILIRVQASSTPIRTFTSSFLSTTTSSLCLPLVSLSSLSIHPPPFLRAGRSPHAHLHVHPPPLQETSPTSNGLPQPLRQNIATVSQPHPVSPVHSDRSRRCLQHLR